MLNLKSTRVHFLMILIIVLVGFTIFLVHFYHSPEVMMLDEPFWSKEFRTALLLSLIITIPMIVEVLIDGFSLIIAKEAEIINWIIRLVLIISHNVPILLLLDKSLRRDCSAPASLHTIAFINHAFLACICMSLCQDHQNLGIGPVCIVASIMYGVGVYTGCCYIFNKSSISIVSVISIITAYLLFTYIFGKYTINLFRRYKKWDCNDIHYLAYFSGFLLLSIGSITIASSFKYELTPLSVSLQINLTSLFLLIITTLPCQISKYNLRRLLRRMIEKEAFIRYISHEIRTPLNTVFLGLNFIKEELLGVAPLVSETVEPILETVTEVNNCCQIALSIVNDLLTFDKLEEGKMSLELIETDIQRYVSETIKLFDIPAREKRISIEVAAKDEEMGWLSSLVLRVDQHKMSQVIRNIISNAIKFTPDDGKISVTMSLVKFQIDGKNHNEGKILNNHRSRTHLPTKLKSSSHDCMESSFDNSRTGNIRRQSKLMMNKIRGRAAPTDYLRIEVKDSGVGISLENQNVLFGQYVQFNASKLQHGNGSGLGLYISKGITELHGGEIW